jgi:arginine/ornithine transport system substrate-binding protein
MQVKCQWVGQEYGGLIPVLNVKRVDAILSSTTITEERKKSADFTDKYYQSPARLAMQSRTQIGDDLSALSSKRIGVPRSSIHDRFATEGCVIPGSLLMSHTGTFLPY